jgi:phage gpG-like protein
VAAEIVLEDKKIQEFFKKTLKNMKDIENGESSFIGIVGATVFKDVIDHFSKEQGQDGPWAPWSKVYQRHMMKIGRQGNKKLQFTGRLRQTFKPTDSRKVSGGLVWYNNAMTKNNFPYAQAHDEGIGSPQREFMWLSPTAVETIAKQIVNFTLGTGG